MRFQRLIFSLSLLLCFSWSGASAQVVPGQGSLDWNRERAGYTADLLRDYNSLMSDWREAWQEGDTSSLAALYSEGAYFFTPDQQVIQGKQAIQRHHATGAPVLDVRTGVSDFVASARLAYAVGPFWYQQEVAGEVRTISGTYITVMAREAGRWKIRSQVFTPQQDTGDS